MPIMTCSNLRGVALATICALIVVWLLPVTCGPTPPVQDTESLQQYLLSLIQSSNGDLHKILQQQTSHYHAPGQVPAAFADHAPRFYAPTFRAPTTPEIPLTPPTFLAQLPSDMGARQRAILTQSTVVSSGDPTFYRDSDLDHSVHVPVAQDAPIATSQPGPSSSGRASDTAPRPNVDQQVTQDENLPTSPVSHDEDEDDSAEQPAAEHWQSHDANLVLSTAARYQKRLLYRMAYEPDPSIDAFIADLLSRSADDGEHNVHSRGQVQRVDPASIRPEDPESIAVSTFWHKGSAKVLLMPHPSGPKRLFATFVHKSWFLSHRDEPGFIGVWQLGTPPLITEPNPKRTLTDLFLHGFYPATNEEYRGLQEQPEADGGFWITARRSRDATQQGGLTLKVVKMSDEELHKVDGKLQEGEYAVHHSQIKERPARTNPAAESSEAGFSYHVYVYQDTPELLPLIQDWKAYALLPPSAFEPIWLSDMERAQLSWKIGQAFRFERHVKIFTMGNGEPLMLAFHQKLVWLQRERKQVVSIWRFGANQSAGGLAVARTLSAIGLFHLTQNSWKKLTPDIIPGFRDSVFQYNQVELP